MNSLEPRKDLLIAESELNRAQMAGDLADLVAGVRALADRANSVGSVASATAALVADLAGSRQGKRAEAGAKPSWLRTVLKGAGMISTVWMAIRSVRRGHDEK